MTDQKETIIYSDGTRTNIIQTDDFELIPSTLEKGWYYYDEDFFDITGPFETKEQAQEEQLRYLKFINHEPSVKYAETTIG